MTRFWWVRHGPTHARTLTGWTDLPADLSDTPALDRLAAVLPAHAPVVSSDLARARDTAAALARGRPRLPPDPRLRKIHFGAWEGLSAAEAAARDPARARAFWDGEPVAPPGGETWSDLCARVAAAVDALTGPPDVIVVAHFGAILAAVQRATGLCTPQVLARRIDPLSLTEVARTLEGWRVGPINHRP